MKDLVQKAKELIQRLCLKVKAEWPSFKRLVELLARLAAKKIPNEEIPAAKAESLALLSQTKTILTLITCAIVILLLRGCGDSSASVRRDKRDEAVAKELKRIQELDKEIEEAKKHEFVCSVDGVKYTYFVLKGYATIVRSDASGDVRIPAALDGKPVCDINDNAFYGCSELTSIVIPDGVRNIFKHAFRNCTKLKTVTIPKSVVWICDGVFSKNEIYAFG